VQICFMLDKQYHCYDLPTIGIGGHKGPGIGGNYPQLIFDATLVASMQEATKEVSDAGVRSALQSGISAAIQALQKRGGSHVSIKDDGAAVGPPAGGGGGHGPRL